MCNSFNKKFLDEAAKHWSGSEEKNPLEADAFMKAAIDLARNLYGAVQPAVADACWPTSKMDFRSNEAGRTA